MNVFFCKIIKEYKEKLEFSESKQCCAEHIKMPLLLCRQGAIDWGGFVSAPRLFSSSLCSSALHSLLLFPPYYLGCSINIGQYLVSSSVRLDHTHVPFFLPMHCCLLLFRDGRTYQVICQRRLSVSDKVLLAEKSLSCEGHMM